MLILRSQLFVSASDRSAIVAVRDVSGYSVLIRRGEGRGATVQEVYQGVTLAEALAAFRRACRVEERRLGRGVDVRETDTRLVRWLDRLASIGEFPDEGRPRPRRSLPAPPAILEELNPPVSPDVIWQAWPSAGGSRTSLVMPSAGPTALFVWWSPPASTESELTSDWHWPASGRRIEKVANPTSGHRASAMLASAKIPRGTSIDGLLIEHGDVMPAFLALDVLRYSGEDVTDQPVSARLGLLHQLWEETPEFTQNTTRWQLAATRDELDDSTWLRVWTWRILSAPYGAAGAWGAVPPEYWSTPKP